MWHSTMTWRETRSAGLPGSDGGMSTVVVGDVRTTEQKRRAMRKKLKALRESMRAGDPPPNPCLVCSAPDHWRQKSLYRKAVKAAKKKAAKEAAAE
jgi:hypothetical protein